MMDEITAREQHRLAKYFPHEGEFSIHVLRAIIAAENGTLNEEQAQTLIGSYRSAFSRLVRDLSYTVAMSLIGIGFTFLFARFFFSGFVGYGVLGPLLVLATLVWCWRGFRVWAWAGTPQLHERLMAAYPRALVRLNLANAPMIPDSRERIE
jgi:hypothetical protein